MYSSLVAIPKRSDDVQIRHIEVRRITIAIEILHAHPARVRARIVQVEGMIRSVSGRCALCAVLSGGAHVVGSPEARVDGRLAAGAGIGWVFRVVLPGVVLIVGETGGSDCSACCGGGGVGTCGDAEG